MRKCIFCLSTNPLGFNTKEHILPESIGGGDWAILPEGLFCDACQNKFGSSVEQQALADYPFINMRTLLSIPTKKKRGSWLKYWEGELHAGGIPGQIIYEPNDYFKKSFYSGQKILTFIPAMTKRPDMILRTLLKIGIEVIAGNDAETVFEKRFDAAREYALTGIKKHPWFYIQKEDNGLLNKYLKGESWADDHYFMDVHYEENGLVFLNMRTLYLQFLVPLVENVILEGNFNACEPSERVFFV
ncbi:MAG TPA: HNH endonuclease [Saprospiraceae bacterium]|nr:HNH endonuclease [Saprospiraceae bacterium]